MIDSKPTTAIVQQAEETERQLVERAIAAMDDPNWTIGECASLWTERYSRDRGSDHFGDLIGLSGQQVARCRSVWMTFADVRDEYPSLKWTHFYTASGWDDSAECLAWAEENQASVREMKAWRKMNTGEDSEPPNDHFEPEKPPSMAESDDHEIQTVGQSEGFDDAEAEHAGEADPYRKPPSTVVNTPRDFDEPTELDTNTNRPIVSEVIEVLSQAIDKWSSFGVNDMDRRIMATQLRQLADEIEGAA